MKKVIQGFVLFSLLASIMIVLIMIFKPMEKVPKTSSSDKPVKVETASKDTGSVSSKTPSADTPIADDSTTLKEVASSAPSKPVAESSALPDLTLQANEIVVSPTAYEIEETVMFKGFSFPVYSNWSFVGETTDKLSLQGEGFGIEVIPTRKYAVNSSVFGAHIGSTQNYGLIEAMIVNDHVVIGLITKGGTTDTFEAGIYIEHVTNPIYISIQNFSTTKDALLGLCFRLVEDLNLELPYSVKIESIKGVQKISEATKIRWYPDNAYGYPDMADYQLGYLTFSAPQTWQAVPSSESVKITFDNNRITLDGEIYLNATVNNGTSSSASQLAAEYMGQFISNGQSILRLKSTILPTGLVEYFCVDRDFYIVQIHLDGPLVYRLVSRVNVDNVSDQELWMIHKLQFDAKFTPTSDIAEPMEDGEFHENPNK